MKKKPLLLVITLLFAVITILAACANSESKVPNTNETINDLVEINQSGVNLEGSVISWANMKIDNPDLQLTDDQKKVLKYFDQDYLQVMAYDNLQRYPQAYRNAQVYFKAYILKVLVSTDDEYECLAVMTEYYPNNEQDFIREAKGDNGEIGVINVPGDLSTVRNLTIIKGKPSNARIIQGDALQCFGRYQDVISYEIDGKSYQLPTVSINHTTGFDISSGYNYEKFDLSYINDVAKIIFGDDIKVSEPDPQNFDFEKHIPEERYYIVTPDRQISADFTSFDFDANYGYIVDSKSTLTEPRSFFVSADFEHYIVSVHNRSLKMFYLEYYDRDFNKIWGREFSNVDTVPYDYTIKNIYLCADTELHIIDIETGEDMISPVLVGQKVKVNAVEDGIILVGKGNKDTIMKTDRDGNILWKTSIDFDVTTCDVLQIVDNNVITKLIHIEYRNPDDTNSGITAFLEKVIVINTEGEQLLEFNDGDYDYNRDNGNYNNSEDVSVSSAPVPLMYATVIPKEGLNLRNTPSTSSESFGVIPCGTTLPVYDVTSYSGWAIVSVIDSRGVEIYGYVAIDYLRF